MMSKATSQEPALPPNLESKHGAPLATQGIQLFARPIVSRNRRLAVAFAAACLLTSGCSAPDNKDAASSDPSIASPSLTKATVTSLIAAGLKQATSGHLDDARVTFGKALDLDPKNAYVLYNLGYIAQAKGDPAAAISRYAQALAIEENFAPAMFNLAVLTEGSNLKASVNMYRRIVARDPEHASAYVRLGYALLHMGRTAEGNGMLNIGFTLDRSLAQSEPPTYR